MIKPHEFPLCSQWKRKIVRVTICSSMASPKVLKKPNMAKWSSEMTKLLSKSYPCFCWIFQRHRRFYRRHRSKMSFHISSSRIPLCYVLLRRAFCVRRSTFIYCDIRGFNPLIYAYTYGLAITYRWTGYHVQIKCTVNILDLQRDFLSKVYLSHQPKIRKWINNFLNIMFWPNCDLLKNSRTLLLHKKYD